MNTNLNMQRMPIDRLKPAKYNPRKDLKPGDPAYEKIKRSLHDFGYVDPIVWNEVTGNIVGGHQRYKVLKAEGATEVDCVVVHIENPQDEKALNIALNKATGDWEPTALADLLQDLQLSGYDLGATGFDAAEVDDLFSKVHDKDVHDDDCDIDPEEVQPYVRPGDIWTLGRHRMMCGDSTDGDAVDALMDGVKANLVVTDPPYNVAYESADGKKIQNDSMADEQFFRHLLHRPLIINASRGGVVDNEALLWALNEGLIADAVIDTWEGEPDLNRELLEQVVIGTPHVAGYSADGKANATRMSLEAVAQFMGVDFKPQIDLPDAPCLSVETLLDDSRQLKLHPDRFEEMRGNYPVRRERLCKV